jgi:hypothetical protein
MEVHFSFIDNNYHLLLYLFLFRFTSNNLMRNLLYGLLLLAFFTGCIKKPNYPVIPEISYKGFAVLDVNIGRGALIFDYKDGDGDLGYTTTERNDKNYDIYYKVFNLNPDNTFSTAFTIEEIIKDGDTTYLVDSIFENYLPNVDLSGQKKGITGDITYSASFNINDKSKIKIKFYIYDRARNKSNEIETPIIQFK